MQARCKTYGLSSTLKRHNGMRLEIRNRVFDSPQDRKVLQTSPAITAWNAPMKRPRRIWSQDDEQRVYSVHLAVKPSIGKLRGLIVSIGDGENPSA
jgi:hypothetical protein